MLQRIFINSEIVIKNNEKNIRVTKGEIAIINCLVKAKYKRMQKAMIIETIDNTV